MAYTKFLSFFMIPFVQFLLVKNSSPFPAESYFIIPFRDFSQGIAHHFSLPATGSILKRFLLVQGRLAQQGQYGYSLAVLP